MLQIIQKFCLGGIDCRAILKTVFYLYSLSNVPGDNARYNMIWRVIDHLETLPGMGILRSASWVAERIRYASETFLYSRSVWKCTGCSRSKLRSRIPTFTTAAWAWIFTARQGWTHRIHPGNPRRIHFHSHRSHPYHNLRCFSNVWRTNTKEQLS